MTIKRKCIIVAVIVLILTGIVGFLFYTGCVFHPVFRSANVNITIMQKDEDGKISSVSGVSLWCNGQKCINENNEQYIVSDESGKIRSKIFVMGLEGFVSNFDIYILKKLERTLPPIELKYKGDVILQIHVEKLLESDMDLDLIIKKLN